MSDTYRTEDLAEIAPFAKAYRCFLFDNRLQSSAKVLYLVLKAHCIGTDETFVSISTLATETDCHTNTVSRNLRALVKVGFIREQSRGRNRSTIKVLVGLSNLYSREQALARLGSGAQLNPTENSGPTKNSHPTKNGVPRPTENGGLTPPKTVGIHRRRDGEEDTEKKGKVAAVLVELWNGIKRFRRIHKMTPTRVQKLCVRLKDDWWRDNWMDALKKADGIAGLSGANSRDWVANIDWFLKPDTVTRIMEGFYDGWNDGRDGKPVKPQSKPQTSKWDDPKWHARQAKIHDLWDRKKREAKDKGKPEPKSPQGYDSKWKPKVAEDSVDEDEKLPF